MPRANYADFAIMTAIPLEMSVALELIFDKHDYQMYSTRTSRMTYHRCIVSITDSSQQYVTVIAMTEPHYGGATAAALAYDILDKWNPQRLSEKQDDGLNWKNEHRTICQ